MEEELSELLKVWEETGEMDDEIADEIVERFDDLFKKEFLMIEKVLMRSDEDSGYIALSHMQFLTSAVNAIVPKKPKLVKNLKKNLKNFKSVLEKIAKNVKADSFSISVGFPSGISISLSFKV